MVDPLFEKLRPHIGHDIDCHTYNASNGDILSAVVACMDCQEVLVTGEADPNHWTSEEDQETADAWAAVDGDGLEEENPVPTPKETRLPKAGEIYTHYKGNDFRVIAVGLMEASGQLAVRDNIKYVVYEPYSGPVAPENDWVWIRPLDEWYEEVTFSKPRFTLKDDGKDK